MELHPFSENKTTKLEEEEGENEDELTNSVEVSELDKILGEYTLSDIVSLNDGYVISDDAECLTEPLANVLEGSKLDKILVQISKLPTLVPIVHAPENYECYRRISLKTGKRIVRDVPLANLQAVCQFMFTLFVKNAEKQGVLSRSKARDILNKEKVDFVNFNYEQFCRYLDLIHMPVAASSQLKKAFQDNPSHTKTIFSILTSLSISNQIALNSIEDEDQIHNQLTEIKEPLTQIEENMQQDAHILQELFAKQQTEYTSFSSLDSKSEEKEEEVIENQISSSSSVVSDLPEQNKSDTYTNSIKNTLITAILVAVEKQFVADTHEKIYVARKSADILNLVFDKRATTLVAGNQEGLMFHSSSSRLKFAIIRQAEAILFCGSICDFDTNSDTIMLMFEALYNMVSTMIRESNCAEENE